jgi:integrase
MILRRWTVAYAKKRVGSDGKVRWSGVYLDPRGRERSAGTFDGKRAAEKAARLAEGSITNGEWIDPANARMTFREYVEGYWWPSKHLEVYTRVTYRTVLEKHFLPFFGGLPMGQIVPTTIEAWVAQAAPKLSPKSVRQYVALLSQIFKKAIRDRVVNFNPCDGVEMPKLVRKPLRIPTPAEFDAVLTQLPLRYQPLVLVDIETGMRWGELIALRPRHIDFLRRCIRVEQVIIEIPKRRSPTGERMIVKDYPKDDEPRTLRISDELLQTLAAIIQRLDLEPDDLLFPSTDKKGGGALSRNTFRTKIWLPALERSGIGYHLRVHDLRHAHASWSLAGGADVTAVMERLGHRQLATTQRYLHTLPDSDDRALAAFRKIRES